MEEEEESGRSDGGGGGGSAWRMSLHYLLYWYTITCFTGTKVLKRRGGLAWRMSMLYLIYLLYWYKKVLALLVQKYLKDDGGPAWRMSMHSRPTADVNHAFTCLLCSKLGTKLKKIVVN